MAFCVKCFVKNKKLEFIKERFMKNITSRLLFVPLVFLMALFTSVAPRMNLPNLE